MVTMGIAPIKVHYYFFFIKCPSCIPWYLYEALVIVGFRLVGAQLGTRYLLPLPQLLQFVKRHDDQRVDVILVDQAHQILLVVHAAKREGG